MSERKKDKLIQSEHSMKTLVEKGLFPLAEGHSQDADRHHKIKHPSSEQ